MVEYPIKLIIPSSLPSWNHILGLEHWGRAKLKKEIQEGFSSALRASVTDCSMRTTCARNTMSIACDTLASYQTTLLAKRKLRLAKKRLAAKSLKESK